MPQANDEFAVEKVSDAIVRGDVELVRRWLATGTDLGKKKYVGPDGYAWSPLELAAMAEARYQGAAEVSRLLVDASSPLTQASALHCFAAEEKTLPEVRALLAAGVPVDALSAQGGTALQLAVGNNNPQMVQLLLKHRANPTLEGRYGSALRIAGDTGAMGQMMGAAIEGKPFCLFACHDLAAVRMNIERLARDVRAFLLAHPDEDFYAVAFEHNAKANSERTFNLALEQARANFPEAYEQPAKIQKLRYSVGNFGFTVPPATNATVPPLDFGFLAQRGPDDDRTEKELLVEAFTLNRPTILAGIAVAPTFQFMARSHVF